MSDRDERGRIRVSVDAPRQDDPVRVARAFLRKFASDVDGDEEILDGVAAFSRWSTGNRRSVSEGLAALDAVLAAPSEGETIRWLVGDYAGEAGDSGAEGARTWLTDLADRIRKILGDRT